MYRTTTIKTVETHSSWHRQLRRHLFVVALAALPLSMLAGCTEDEPVAESGSTANRPVNSGGSGPTDPDDGSRPGEGHGSKSGTGTSAPTKGCSYLDVSETGVYDLGEVVSATISWKDGKVTLESTEPAEGWTARPDSDMDDLDEVEVDFVRDDRRVEFDAEIERDGRLEVKLCEAGLTGD